MFRFFLNNKDVFQTSIKTALVVGTLLAIINHSEEILYLTFTPRGLIEIGVTYLVPFSVATYAGLKQAQRAPLKE
jgi:hypothetical protein